MRSVRDIPVLSGIPVLLRAALNVPIKDGKVADPFRLTRALATIRYLQEKGAKVILAGHLGDKGTESMKPVFEALQKHLKHVHFCDVATGVDARRAAHALSRGDVLVLENLRREVGEKKNDSAFARELASLADVFVQDSFDVLHREHASVVGVPHILPSYAGLLVEEEVRELSKALTPGTPSLAIVGGAKFSTKEPVLHKLLSAYDAVFVGGALANDFMRAGGHPVGKSLVSSADTAEIQKLLGSKKLLLPKDYVVAPAGGTRSQGRICGVDAVATDEAILDNGPETIAMLGTLAAHAKTVLWNGPLGNYENGFVEGTEGLATVIARSGAHSIVGGGDTVAAIESLNLSSKFSFISTGGGAMLDFLAKGTLPGIEALG